MKIAIFGKRRQDPDDVCHINALLKRLSELGIFTCVDRHFYEALSRLSGTAPEADDVFEEDDFTADFCFSIGGDGTFLRTARRVGTMKYLSSVSTPPPRISRRAVNQRSPRDD